jgi:hypothetical protein
MGDMPSMDAYTEDTVAATMTARDSAMAWDLKNGGSDLTRALVFFHLPVVGTSTNFGMFFYIFFAMQGFCIAIKLQVFFFLL